MDVGERSIVGKVGFCSPLSFKDGLMADCEKRSFHQLEGFSFLFFSFSGFLFHEKWGVVDSKKPPKRKRKKKSIKILRIKANPRSNGVQI